MFQVFQGGVNGVNANYSEYDNIIQTEPHPSSSSAKVIVSSSNSSSYFNGFFNGKPTLAELFEHVRVGTKWYTLELDTTKLDSVRFINQESDVKAIKKFELWIGSKPKAMRKEIIDTIQKDTIGENSMAEEYQSVSEEIS